MANTRWDRDLSRFQGRLNRLFEDALGRDQPEDAWSSTEWAPPVDVYERDGMLRLQVDLPGVWPEDVRVTVENNVLSIAGERKPEIDAQRENAYRVERVHGRFHRSFTLSPLYDTESIEASFQNGVLRLSIPRSERARPRQIPITGAQELSGKGRPAERETEQEQDVAVTR